MQISIEEARTRKARPILDWKTFSKIPYRPLNFLPEAKDPQAPDRVLESLPESLKTICEEMAATCLGDDGLGLAAPQIGYNLALVVILQNEGKGPCEFFFNPGWSPLEGDREITIQNEACLSVKGKTLPIERFAKIQAFWYAYENGGFSLRKEILSGFGARVFQHEVDHLWGRSIVDRFNRQQEKKNPQKNTSGRTKRGK